jgi:hypothetical protein
MSHVSLPVLNAAFREALKRDRAKLNDGMPRHYPRTYDGSYLTWGQLAELVWQRLRPEGQFVWTVDLVQEAIEKDDRALPREWVDREEFLIAVQNAVSYCLRRSIEYRIDRNLPAPNPTNESYVSEFLGRDPALGSYRPFGFNPQNIGFFKILDWNSARPLLEKNVGLVRKYRQARGLWDIPIQEMQEYLDRERALPGAPCPSLVDYVEDTREINNDLLELWVVDSSYYEHVAIRKYMADHPDFYELIESRINKEGLRPVLVESPPSNICINVTVLSREGSVLTVQRSGGSRVWPGYYQLGPHETMLTILPGQSYENCFELGWRALREEVNIGPSDCYGGRMVFSWFGYYLPDCSAYFFAHVRSTLTKSEIVERCIEAESAFEIEDVVWLDFTGNLVGQIVEQWPTRQPSAEGLLKFLPHSAVAATQLYRVLGTNMLPGPNR